MSKLELFTSEVCPYAQRVRIALALKGIEHEVVELDYDDKPEWFMRLTPAGRVPVIRHDDFVLWESATINEYLDASFPGRALRPADERGRARMRNEIRHFDSVFLPALYRLLFTQDAAGQDRARAAVVGELEFLETRIAALQAEAGAGPWWLGDEIGLTDLALFPFFERFEVFNHYRGLEIPSGCERLRQWWGAARAEPACAATMHDLEYFIPRYAAYANDTAEGLSAQAFRSGAVN